METGGICIVDEDLHAAFCRDRQWPECLASLQAMVTGLPGVAARRHS